MKGRFTREMARVLVFIAAASFAGCSGVAYFEESNHILGGDSPGDAGPGNGDGILTDGNPFEDIDPAPCNVNDPEVCNGRDDDCDGLVDKLDPNLVLGPEVCDGNDNDCDGLYDYDDPGRRCTDALGAIVPCDQASETRCDGIDDDCNRAVDEGLLSPCGTCDGYPSCYTGQPPYCDGSLPAGSLGACAPGSGDRGSLPVPDPTSSTDPDNDTVQQPGSDTDHDGRGAVTLQTGTLTTDFAWPASETNGTVSRIDTLGDIEIARYASVLKLAGDVRRPYVADYDFTPDLGPRTACQEPSRSTVDGVGNAYIANRAVEGYTGKCDDENNAPNQMGSVTKVAYYDAIFCNSARNPGLAGCACTDRNGDGYIETSHDYDVPANGVQVSGGPRKWQNCANYGSAECLTVIADDCVGDRCNRACDDDASCRLACQSPADCPGSAACTADSTGTKYCQDASPYYCVHDATPAPAGVTHAQRCSTSPTLPEFLGRSDECLAWTRRIPHADDVSGGAVITDANKNDASLRSVPRAMAIDKKGYIWVGAYQAQKAFKLDTNGNFHYPADTDGAGPITVDSICPVTLRRVSDGAVFATYSYDPVSGAQTVTGNPAPCAATDCVEALPASCHLNLPVLSYGAVVDSGRSNGEDVAVHPAYLYFTQPNGALQRINTDDGTQFSAPLGNAAAGVAAAYGITIDHRDRAWTPAAATLPVPVVHRYMPKTNSWTSFAPSGCVGNQCATVCTADATCTALGNHTKCSVDLGGHRGCTRTCGATPECQAEGPGTECVSGVCAWDTHDGWYGRGATTEIVGLQSQPPGALVANCDEQQAAAPCSRVWTIFNNGGVGVPNWLFAFDADTGREIVDLRRRLDTGAACTGPTGVGIGAGGIVWTVDQTSDQMCGYDPKPPLSVNPGDPTANPLAMVPIDTHPYTYSDFTGNIFRSFTNPNGHYRVVIAGCPAGTGVSWRAITWDAETPGGSKLEVRFRFAGSALQAANPGIAQEPTPPVVSQGATPTLRYDFPPPDRLLPYVQVDFTFLADEHGVVPVLYRVDAIRACTPLE